MKYSFNHSYFNQIDTEEKAYWLGMISADGCVMSSGGSKLLSINLHQDDAGHLEKFRNSIGGNNTVRKFERLDPRTKKIHYGCEIRVYSAIMYDDLVSHGVTERKSLTLDPPIGVPKNLIRHYIRGYSDGDSSIFRRSDGRWGLYTVGTEQFLEWTNVYLPVPLKIRSRGTWFIAEGGAQDTVRRNVKYMYSGATIFLDRKMEKAKQAHLELGACL